MKIEKPADILKYPSQISDFGGKRKPLLKCMNQNERARRGRKEYWPELEKNLDRESEKGRKKSIYCCNKI